MFWALYTHHSQLYVWYFREVLLPGPNAVPIWGQREEASCLSLHIDHSVLSHNQYPLRISPYAFGSIRFSTDVLSQLNYFSNINKYFSKQGKIVAKKVLSIPSSEHLQTQAQVRCY